MVTRHIAHVLHFKCLHRTAHIHGPRSLNRVADTHIANRHGGDVAVRLFD